MVSAHETNSYTHNIKFMYSNLPTLKFLIVYAVTSQTCVGHPQGDCWRKQTFDAEASSLIFLDNTWKVLKCGAGEGWRRSAGPIMWVKEQRNILHEIRKRKANWIGHILRRNCLLQRVIAGKIKGGGGKWQENEEEDVGSYWLTLRTGEDTLIWRREL